MKKMLKIGLATIAATLIIAMLSLSNSLFGQSTVVKEIDDNDASKNLPIGILGTYGAGRICAPPGGWDGSNGWICGLWEPSTTKADCIQ
jgi:hypothetical protein